MSLENPTGDLEIKKADIERRRKEELAVYGINSTQFKNVTNYVFKNSIIAFAAAKAIPGLYEFAIKNRTHKYDPTVVDQRVKLQQAVAVAAEAQKNGIAKDLDIQTLRSHIKSINTTLCYQDEINAKYDAELAALKPNSSLDIDSIISKF